MVGLKALALSPNPMYTQVHSLTQRIKTREQISFYSSSSVTLPLETLCCSLFCSTLPLTQLSVDTFLLSFLGSLHSCAAHSLLAVSLQVTHFLLRTYHLYRRSCPIYFHRYKNLPATSLNEHSLWLVACFVHMLEYHKNSIPVNIQLMHYIQTYFILFSTHSVDLQFHGLTNIFIILNYF